MRYLILLCVIHSIPALSQSTQNEIDNQVWKPFTEAIMNQDPEKFLSVHSKDVIRIERDSKKIIGFDEYRKTITEGWPRWKESQQKNKIKYTFELRFLERIANENTAHEVGYFKNETTNANGETRKSFGKFHVVLRKEHGTWKILVDSDSNEGRSITEEMFLAATGIQ